MSLECNYLHILESSDCHILYLHHNVQNHIFFLLLGDHIPHFFRLIAQYNLLVGTVNPLEYGI